MHAVSREPSPVPLGWSKLSHKYTPIPRPRTFAELHACTRSCTAQRGHADNQLQRNHKFFPSVILMAHVSEQQIDKSQALTLCHSSVICTSKEGKLYTGHDSVIKIWWECFRSQEWCLLHSVKTPVEGEVTCITVFPSNFNLFATSVNNSILIYDIRQISQPQQHMCFNRDEINQLDVNNKETFLCSCDDSGEIKVINIDNGTLFKTLSRCHTNICSSVKFNPRKPWEVISGGLDCQVVRWDFNLGRPLCSVSTEDVQGGDTVSYVVNPPLVHTIDVIPSKFCVVCGLGSGAVVVYGMKTPKSLITKCTASLHSSGVGSLCVVDSSQLCGEPLVVSGGNDGKICVSRLIEKDTRQTKHYSEFLLKEVVEIKHCNKVNWVCARQGIDDNRDRFLYVFVADLSNIVYKYKIVMK